MNGKVKEAAGDKILLSKLPLDVGEKEVLCSGGSGKLITFALVVQEDYGPLERRVFDLQFSGQVSGAVVAFQLLGDASVARAKYV